MSRKHMGAGDKLEQYWASVKSEKLDTLKYCILHSGINFAALRNDDEDRTGVMVAAFENKPKSLLILLDILRSSKQLKESIDLTDEEGRTALMLAAAKGNVKCVDHLCVAVARTRRAGCAAAHRRASTARPRARLTPSASPHARPPQALLRRVQDCEIGDGEDGARLRRL